MSLFGKFIKGKEDMKTSASVISKKSLFDCGVDIDKSSYYQLFSAALGRIAVNQSKCSEKIVRGRNWNIDFARGVISFGDDIYAAQLIGTESKVSNSWLWGWANPSGLNESVLSYANELHNFGEANKLEVFETKNFELKGLFNGHNIGIIASALHDENVCYYRCPYDGGAAFVVFSNIDNEVFKQIDMVTFSKYVNECIQKFNVDHMIFIKSFLFQNECAYRYQGNSVIGDFPGGQRLEFVFEEVDGIKRLMQMKNF